MGKGGLTPARAVFLDRDGVLNENVFNPLSAAWESPLTVDQFRLIPGVLDALAKLQSARYLLFLVSNQPNYAKGKSTLANLARIHRKFEDTMVAANIIFAGIDYCFHHPDGVVASHAGQCRCRKPSPYFLLRARDRFNLDMVSSWMIGDRGTDVECGRAAGVRTILIADKNQTDRGDTCQTADFVARDISAAAAIVIDAEPPSISAGGSRQIIPSV